MAVVAFRLNSHCYGKSEQMKCQSNRHKLHPLSESVGQPRDAQVYPSRVLPDTSRIAAGNLEYINGSYLCQFLQRLSKGAMLQRTMLHCSVFNPTPLSKKRVYKIL